MKKKFFSVSLLILILISLTACGTETSLNTKPETVRQAALQIASIDVPEGFRPEFSASLMGYTAASFRGQYETSHLYLIQSDKDDDQEQLEQMLSEIVIGTGDGVTGLVVVDIQKAEVRGEETQMIISEGVNSEGVTYRQGAAVFQGNGGPALLVYLESVGNWDQAVFDTLLASIQ
ncbi:MAG TPA: hypothetical protein VJ965_07835 [Anaerolineales bacterium]|nr:hypothetical protein [Anaerolineales bacterium]